jgi:CelD/BcsL family acetyltransferase involved in cellulose biosynthesis
VIDHPQVLTDLSAVEALLPEWRALAASSARSPLEAPDWLLPITRHYLGGDGVRLLAWRRGGELVGVAPLGLFRSGPTVRRVRQLAWWGTVGPRMRGLVDVVAREDARSEVLDSLCEWLDANREWDVLRLVRPQAGSLTPDRLRDAARGKGWTYAGYENLRSSTYQLVLPDSIEGWERHLRPKTRSTARREARRYAEAVGGEMVAALSAREIPEGLDAVERLLSERWGDAEVYFSRDPRFRPLVHEAVPALAAAGHAWVSVVRDRGVIRACLVSVAQNGYAMALLVAATDAEEFRAYSLGKHVFNIGIGEAVRRGCHTYDFLWVGGYKETYWHAQPRYLESAMVGRGFVGRTFARVLARREGRARVPLQG